MAFYEENEGGNGGKFLKILQGCIVAKSDEEKEGYEKFETKNPQTDAEVVYYIKKYKGGVEGRILGLERVELEGVKVFGYNLHMEDEDGKFSIFFADDRTTTERLLKVYENINLDEEVRIKVFKDDEGHPAISFTQGGQKVPQKWVGGKEGNLPQPKKTKGKWDYSAVSEFLYNNAMENIVPNYVKPEKASAAGAGSELPATTGTAVGKDDEIPF